MFAISIESSHRRGMGHFFRALNILEYLKSVNEPAIVIINNDTNSLKMLKEKNISYEVVDYNDITSNWEKGLIHKYHVDVWLLDKFETNFELSEHVKREGIILAAIDDRGLGAELVDLHFCSMIYDNLMGKNIYTGKKYMVLNTEIAKYRRKRTELKRILVTLGGSDTYGVTIQIVKILKKQEVNADIVVGPNFRHQEQLKQETGGNFTIYNTVPSLIAKFYDYDLAITGGGISCFESNASGLPCIIVANEIHEIDNGKYLAGFGGAIFAGHYKDISAQVIDIKNLNVKAMSEMALQALPLNGMENIYLKVQEYRRSKNAGCNSSNTST